VFRQASKSQPLIGSILKTYVNCNQLSTLPTASRRHCTFDSHLTETETLRIHWSDLNSLMGLETMFAGHVQDFGSAPAMRAR
jgi:hypothetical protein